MLHVSCRVIAKELLLLFVWLVQFNICFMDHCHSVVPSSLICQQSPAKPSQQSDMTSKLTDMEVSVEDQSSSDSDPAKDQPGTSSGESQPAHTQMDEHPTHAATTSMTPTSSIATTTTTTTSTDTDGKDGTNLPGGSSRDSQTQSQATGSSKKVFFSSQSDEEEDEDEDEDDDESEEEEGIPVSGKYTTSGTQTPYTKR